MHNGRFERRVVVLTDVEFSSEDKPLWLIKLVCYQ